MGTQKWKKRTAHTYFYHRTKEAFSEKTTGFGGPGASGRSPGSHPRGRQREQLRDSGCQAQFTGGCQHVGIIFIIHVTYEASISQKENVNGTLRSDMSVDQTCHLPRSNIRKTSDFSGHLSPRDRCGQCACLRSGWLTPERVSLCPRDHPSGLQQQKKAPC